MSPTLATVIPVFNARGTIRETLDSVRAQTRAPDEVVIVDDGSTDGSGDVVQAWLDEVRDPRYRLIRQKNAGGAAARANGIQAAKSEWIALLDSDDLWKPRKLELQEKFLQDHPAVGLVYCDQEWIDENGRRLDDVTREGVHPRYRGRLKDVLLRQGNVIVGSNSAAVFRKSLWAEAGGHDRSLRVCEDWDLWIRLADLCEIDFHPEVLVALRVRGGRISSNWFGMMRGDLTVLAKHSDDRGVLRSYLRRTSRKTLLRLIVSGRARDLRDLTGQFVKSDVEFLSDVVQAFWKRN